MSYDWFAFKGVDCRTYGIHVADQPEINVPNPRATFTNIPGRSGSLTILEGEDIYDDRIISLSCVIKDLSRLNDITRWLRGNGNLVLANRNDGYFDARFVNQISFNEIAKGRPNRNFTLNFRTQPFLHLTSGDIPYAVSNNTSYTVYGNVNTEPIVNIWGKGDITLQITHADGSVVSETTITGLPDSTATHGDYTTYNKLTLDAEAKIAWYTAPGSTAKVLATGLLNGDWMSIDASQSTYRVNCTAASGSTIARVEITPRWETL